jgi:phosphoribosylamine--glycine ligase
LDDKLTAEVEREVLVATVDALRRDGVNFQGVLYAGLMLTAGGPKVLEFNCRFGDPETQPIMMRLEDDLFDVLMRAVDGRLEGMELHWSPKTAVCVVMSAMGYPGEYLKGSAIEGLDDAARLDGVVVFHAGTATKRGRVVTSGGRVLGVTALGEGARDAIEKAYRAVDRISWEGAYYRKDIGQKALKGQV